MGVECTSLPGRVQQLKFKFAELFSWETDSASMAATITIRYRIYAAVEPDVKDRL